MTSQMNTKVRLVRCPRCRQVLPELADVPVYKCGGCGAILQAKNRKRDAQDTGSIVPEADSSQTNGLDHVLNASTNVSDSDKSPERHGSGLDFRKEGLGDLNQSHKHDNSDVISCHENTGSSPETSGHAGAEENNILLVQYGSEDQNKLGDGDNRHPQDTCVSSEILSSPELDLHEDKSLEQGPGAYEIKSFTPLPRKEDENQYSLGNISDGGQNDPQNSKKELPTSTTFSRDLSYESSENGNLSPVSGNDRDMDEDLENHSSSRSPAAVAFPDTSPEGQVHKAQSSSNESDSPDNQMFPFSESMKQAQEETLPDFQRVSSADTLENMPQVFARTDLGVTLRSSTAKNYYAYDVNTSSCEETENQVPNQHFRPSRRNFKDAESSSTKGMPKKDGLMFNHRMSSETELPPRPTNSSANLSAKKHQSTKGSKWNRSEFQEPMRHSHPISNRFAMETGEYLSRPPIYSKVSQPVRNGSSSGYEQRSLPERTVDPESDKMELLKMVYELQDQLNRAHLSKSRLHDKFSGRVAKDEELLHAHSNLFVPNKERYPDPDYPRYPEQRDHDRYWSQQVPQMGFSGDATHYRTEVDCSCLRSYRQDRHYSAQLPQYAYYDERHNMAYHRHNNHSPHHSASGSPHHYKPSEFLWSHDTVSESKSEKSYEVNKQQQPAKQHFRPIAGGAPIIVCYCCNEILQLPADFLLFKRRCHRLRCSACTAVLKFSLEHRIHLVEYNAEPRTPPTSEVGGYTETMTLASASRASDDQHGDPVSSSDDYGQSYNRSSTDTEHFSPAPPFQTSNEISDRQKLSASYPFESKKDGKKTIMQDSRNTYKSSRETFEHGGPSKVFEPVNVYSEIEEVSEGGSPLHRLMGYPSPSRLVYRYSADV